MLENLKQKKWFEFIFNPIAFIRNNWMIEFNKILIIFIILFAGTSSAIDIITGKAINYNIIKNIETEIADKALFSWWIYWLYIVSNSIINGILIWFIGGWWFNTRLKLSGDNKSDIKKCRLISTYLNMIKSIPILIFIVISSLFFTNFYATYSNQFIKIFYAILFNGMMIPLIYYEYKIAFENFDIDKKKLNIWFVYIPCMIYLITIGLFIYGIKK